MRDNLKIILKGRLRPTECERRTDKDRVATEESHELYRGQWTWFLRLKGKSLVKHGYTMAIGHESRVCGLYTHTHTHAHFQCAEKQDMLFSKSRVFSWHQVGFTGLRGSGRLN